jgi:RNA polymerase sigma factor (TIGR02999 family)
MPSPAGEITQLLTALKGGRPDAVDRLIPLVYSELRKIARHYLRRERSNHTLQATELADEAWVKLLDQRKVHWKNRSHFFAIAASLMRRALIDHARAHYAGKRGGKGERLSLDSVVNLSMARDPVVLEQYYAQLITLGEALARLEKLDPQQCQIVELRFFAGLKEEEIAEVLNISVRTVRRDWRSARAWLFREITK